MFQAIVIRVTNEDGLKNIAPSNLFETRDEACEWAARKFVDLFCDGDFKMAAEGVAALACNEEGDGFAPGLQIDTAVLDQIAGSQTYSEYEDAFEFRICEIEVPAPKKRAREDDESIEERASKASKEDGPQDGPEIIDLSEDDE